LSWLPQRLITVTVTQLRHNAYVYDDVDEYVARSFAFLRAGLEAGEGAVVANTRDGLAVMREALGTNAGRVRFVDGSEAYTRPAKTLASYHQVYSEELAKHPSLRAVADVQFGPDPGEWDQWTGYEAVFNESFGHLPAWVLCSYNANRCPDPVLEGVWRTHPEVVTSDGWNTSRHYEDPSDLLRAIAHEPETLAGLRPIRFGNSVEEFREALARELVAEQVPAAKMLEMLLAAGEIATNAIEHGGGIEAVRAGRADGRFVCEIVDSGRGFDDPTAGYLAPREGIGGGLWVARQLTWNIEFFESAEGFTARIRL
jgi:anti-sigma regulatory factor (Ser/Thr protein kinase)